LPWKDSEPEESLDPQGWHWAQALVLEQRTVEA